MIARLAQFSVRHRGAVHIAAALVLLTVLVLAVGKINELACRQRLVKAGFPDNYAERLAPLQARHPNWRFVPLPVDDMTWDLVVDKECTPSWNLAAYSTWAPEPYLRLGVTNYLPYYAAKAKAYDSGAWYQASREAIAYFMDPRNFFSEEDVFMFESLEFNAKAHTLAATEWALSQSFMAKAKADGGKRTFAEIVLDVGREQGVSSVFLAARLALEQGNGTVQGLGKIGDSLLELYTNNADRVGRATAWGRTFAKNSAKVKAIVKKPSRHYNGVYNLFNMGACGSGLFEIRYNAWREATSEETCQRYGGPWTTQERAIRGGVRKIRERYVDTCRHTRYFQKFSVVPAAGDFRWKQYMQNIAAPLKESRTTRKAYKAAGTLGAPHRFVIPVYRKMPFESCPDPAKGRSTYSPSCNKP